MPRSIIIPNMEAATLSAIAACVAAGLSLINVGYQAYLNRRNEQKKWLREVLPEAINSYNAAMHEMNRTLFFKIEKWKGPSRKELEESSLEHFSEAMRWLDRIEISGSPKLIRAAHDVSHAISDGDMYIRRTAGSPDYQLETERELYWAYAEASHAFLTAARRELGLRKPPVPVGLEAWRKAQRGRRQGVHQRATLLMRRPIGLINQVAANKRSSQQTRHTDTAD